MAKYPLPPDTFPPVVLSQDDARRLEAAAEEVVKRTVQQYHEHLTVYGGVVDERRWKKIKQREDVRVYRERRASSGASSTTPSTSVCESNDPETGDLDCDGDDPDSDEFKVISSMLTFGSIPGSLEDVLYGTLNPTLRDMRLKSAYVSDGFVDWALVAPIIQPSETNPFRELSIKWTIKAHPLLIGAVMRPRDTLYLDSIGLAQTPSGERIGYQLRHSVDLPEMRELTEHSIVRAKISICHVYRQRKPDCVEVFIRGLVSPMGDAPASLAAATTAQISVSVWKNVHSGEMKKLTRVLRAVAGDDVVSDTSSLLSSSSSSSSGTTDSARGTGSLASTGASSQTSADSAAAKCDLCAANISTSSRKFSLARSSAAKSKHCRVCAALVCSRCCVAKTVHLPSAKAAPDQAKVVQEATVMFCTRCIVQILSGTSMQFAVLDARALQGKSVDYAAVIAR